MASSEPGGDDQSKRSPRYLETRTFCCPSKPNQSSSSGTCIIELWDISIDKTSDEAMMAFRGEMQKWNQ